MADFMLDVVTTSGVNRTIFDTELKANNAARKISKEMAKGKFRNDPGIVTVKGLTGTIIVDPSVVQSVSVTLVKEWREFQERNPPFEWEKSDG